MIFMRRRPLARAAVVGGAAYAVGKSVQRGRDQNAAQQAQIDDLQAQQYAQQQYAQAPAPPAPAGGGAMSDAAIEQLKKLAELHEQGILTDAEFEVQKQKLLQGM